MPGEWSQDVGVSEEEGRAEVNETWFIADLHQDHPGIIRHCSATRPYLRPGDLDQRGRWASEVIKQARCDEMNAAQAAVWNATVGNKDTIYIIGDAFWKNHRKWINELNGKKIMLIGSHDDMPLDALELFKPDWEPLGLEQKQMDAVKTLVQFREVHHSLVRRICGQWMHLYHWPGATWQGKPHGSWFITGHTHGRYKKAQPGEIGGGLILDVGWDVFKRPLNFSELKAEMDKKIALGANKYESKDEIDRD